MLRAQTNLLHEGYEVVEEIPLYLGGISMASGLAIGPFMVPVKRAIE